MWLFLAASFRVRSEVGKSPLFDPRGYLTASGEGAEALLPPELLGAGAPGDLMGGGEATGSLHAAGDYFGEEEDGGADSGGGGAMRAAALASVAASYAQQQQGREGDSRQGAGDHVIVDAPGGSIILAERLPAVRTASTPPPSAYK